MLYSSYLYTMLLLYFSSVYYFYSSAHRINAIREMDGCNNCMNYNDIMHPLHWYSHNWPRMKYILEWDIQSIIFIQV